MASGKKTICRKETELHYQSMMTVGYESESSKDSFDLLIRKIVGREKENQETVAKLREMIKKDRRKVLKLGFELRQREEVIENLTRENGEFDSGLKQAINDLKDVVNEAKKVAAEKEKESECIGDDDTNLTPIVGGLKSIVKHLQKEVQKKEEYFKNIPTKEISTSDKDSATNEKYLRILRDEPKELTIERKQWVQNIANLLSDEDYGSTKITTFEEAIGQIAKLSDWYAALEKEYNELKKRLEKLVKKKKKLHEELTKRLKPRKPLDFLPNKIRHEFEKIASKREKCARSPNPKLDMTVHLTELFQWVSNEYLNDENYLEELSNQCKDAKDKYDRDEKSRNFNWRSIDEEIKKYDDRMKKLQDDNGKARETLVKAKQSISASNALTIEICTQIHGVLDSNYNTTVKHDNLKKELEDENDKRRQTEDIVDLLGHTKARQEDDFKRLDEQIGDQIRRIDDIKTHSYHNKGAKRLEMLKEINEELENKFADMFRTVQKVGPSKFSNDIQRRRIEKLKKTLADKAEKLKDAERDGEGLSRRSKQFKNKIENLADDLKRKKETNDDLNARKNDKAASLNDLKNKQKEIQEKCRNIVNKQSEQYTQESNQNMAMYHKTETRFFANERASQSYNVRNENATNNRRESFYFGQNANTEFKELESHQNNNEEEPNFRMRNQTYGNRQGECNEYVLNKLRSVTQRLTKVENLRKDASKQISGTTTSDRDEPAEDSQTSPSSQCSQFFNRKDRLIMDFYLPIESQSDENQSSLVNQPSKSDDDNQNTPAKDDEVSLPKIEKLA